MLEKQDEPTSSSRPTGRLTNAESFPLLFHQRYQTGRSESTVTAHSLLSSHVPKSEAELRKIKIGQIIFLTWLISSAAFLIIFPPLYNHFKNPGKIQKAYEASERRQFLEGEKCQCGRYNAPKGCKKRESLTAKEISLDIVTNNGTYKVPLTLGGSTCSPILKSNVSECAIWGQGQNNKAKESCEYSRLLGTVNYIFADVKHKQSPPEPKTGASL